MAQAVPSRSELRPVASPSPTEVSVFRPPGLCRGVRGFSPPSVRVCARALFPSVHGAPLPSGPGKLGCIQSHTTGICESGGLLLVPACPLVAQVWVQQAPCHLGSTAVLGRELLEEGQGRWTGQSMGAGWGGADKVGTELEEGERKQGGEEGKLISCESGDPRKAGLSWGT